MSRRNRIGLLGGTFDPIHFGHLIMAENALQQLELDEVIFAPAGSPPHKAGRTLATADDRIRMVELAIAGRPEFVASRIDLEGNGPSFTWQLLERLQQGNHAAEIFFIMGGDSLVDFDQWREPGRILALARLAVIQRPGFDITPSELDDVPGLRARVDLVDAPLCDTSSTDIRLRVSSGRSIRYLVPDAVRDYILAHKVYGKAGT